MFDFFRLPNPIEHLDRSIEFDWIIVRFCYILKITGANINKNSQESSKFLPESSLEDNSLCLACQYLGGS